MSAQDLLGGDVQKADEGDRGVDKATLSSHSLPHSPGSGRFSLLL